MTRDAQLDHARGGRIFHGWWIVAASCIGLSTNPGQFAFGALGLFIIPLGNEFGWNRAQVSLALTFFTIALAVSLPVVGQFVDRYGSKRILIPSILVFGLLLACIPLLVSRLWHLLLIYTLIGSLAAGANALPYLRTIGAWFDRRRGLAYGIAMAGGGLGYAYVPPLVQHLVEQSGWRSGYYALAAIVLLVAMPLVWAVLRDSPAELNLHADGHASAAFAGRNFEEQGMNRGEAVRSPAFWKLVLVFLVLSLCLYGALAHFVPMLIDRGMPARRAALAASTVGMTIIASRAIIGYLIDRFFAPYVAIVCFLLSAFGFALLAAGAVDVAAFSAAMLIGLSIGAEIDLLAYLSSRYFGLRHFGSIYGLQFAAFLLGASAGPVMFGATFELTGAYTAVLAGCIGMLMLVVAITMTLPRFHRPSFL